MIPGITITINSNGLRQLQPSGAQVSAKLGICSAGVANTVATYADSSSMQTALGAGPLVEAIADTLNVAGQPVVAVPLTPSNAGGFGTVNHTGTGTGTVVASAAPAVAIDVKISTSGALGTMAFQYRLNGGVYSAPVTSTVTSFVFAVPGTLTKLTFAAQTYTAGDVWTVATTGAITVVGVGTVTWVTQASSPLDAYAIRATIVTAGGLGVGIFTWSVDGGNVTSAQILIPSSGVYVIANTGVVLTFAGTFTLADMYEYAATTAAFTTSDVTAGFTALLASPTEWGFAQVIGMGANAAAAASLAAIVDAQMVIAAAQFRYVFAMIECPTSESDSTVATAFATFVSERTMVCAGDIGHVSTVSAAIIRRNCSTVVASRLSLIPVSEHPGAVARGALANVKTIYRNEAATPNLDQARFTTLRTLPKKIGYFITRGRMMAQLGSDFDNVMSRRVMDVACGLAYEALLPTLNAKIETDKKTGFIWPPAAAHVEGQVRADMLAGLGDNVQDAAITVSKTEPILQTHRYPVTIGVLPFGYAEFITTTIGFIPSLPAA